MSIKLPRPVLFALAFITAFALYFPALTGTPIWDDYTFWFNDPVMKGGTTYTDIWLRFAWPFSVSLQKLLLEILRKDYFSYHLINFVLHAANSFLVYKLARYVRLKYAFIAFLLFLFHPIAVISTAWMVQIKTLLCFFFGLASVLTFLKGQKDIRWMVFSWLLFALSLTSKSASISLPIILLVVSLKTHGTKKLLLLIPFFLFSGASTYRVLTSKITLEGKEKATEAIAVKIEKAPSVKPVAEKPKPKPVPRPATEKPKVGSEKPKPAVAAKAQPAKPIVNNTSIKKDSWLNFSSLKISGGLILQTLNYYFWQTILPLDNSPVKGLNYDKPDAFEFVHVFFLVCLVILFFKDKGLFFLGAAHFLLLPFLGLVPAPYMNVTWVSDQHLYLVLPALLFFWVRVVERIPWKYAFLIPVPFILFFCFNTHEAMKYYQSETSFYEGSLKANPLNIPIAYNLASTYLQQNETGKAHEKLQNIILLAEGQPEMKRSPYYRYVVQLYIELQGDE